MNSAPFQRKFDISTFLSILAMFLLSATRLASQDWEDGRSYRLVDEAEDDSDDEVEVVGEDEDDDSEDEEDACTCESLWEWTQNHGSISPSMANSIARDPELNSAVAREMMLQGNLSNVSLHEKDDGMDIVDRLHRQVATAGRSGSYVDNDSALQFFADRMRHSAQQLRREEDILAGLEMERKGWLCCLVISTTTLCLSIFGSIAWVCFSE